MDSALVNIQKNLEEIRKVENDVEFWSARELMEVLGYTNWIKFSGVIERARNACTISGQNTQDHFVGADEMVLTGSGAKRVIKNVLLTRYACYLIAQNGDPRKPQIALAQTYFATQTRKQELLERREKETKRLESREKLKDTEKKITNTVYGRGITLPAEFGTFKNKHIEALYGGVTTRELKKNRKIPLERSLADFDTDVELRAKDFALAMTDHSIKENNLQGSHQMTEEVVKNSKATRRTLLSRSIRPEVLKPEEDLKKVEGRRKKELKTTKRKKLK